MFFLSQSGPAKMDRAKLDIKRLDTALQACEAEHKEYPESLEGLVKAQRLDPKALTDPWGQPYVYEPAARHPTTGRPTIYSKGPPGGEQVIDNWYVGQ